MSRLFRKRNVIAVAAIGVIAVGGWQLLALDGALALVGVGGILEALPAGLAPLAAAAAPVAVV